MNIEDPLSYHFKKTEAPLKKVKSIQFGIFSPDEIRAQSVTKAGFIQGHKFIDSGITISDTNKPNLQSLSDPRLGSLDDLDDPGNFGHIELVRPVYHFGLLDTIYTILKCVGYYSHKVRIDSQKIHDTEGTYDTEGQQKLKDILSQIDNSGINYDIHDPIHRPQPTFHRQDLNIIIDFDTKIEKSNEDNIIIEKGRRKLRPLEALNILRDLSDEDITLLGFNPLYSRPEWFIIQVLPIPPPHVRPAVVASETMVTDDDLTIVYRDILQTNELLDTAIKNGENIHIIDARTELLATQCSILIDNDNAIVPHAMKDSKPLQTITQRLVGKGGRVRSNLMGKRVDFTARSVITADPNISIDQLGVPERIAINMTIPERVTMYNRIKLIKLINNGPYTYPGARYIIRNTSSDELPEKIDLRVIAISSIVLKIGDIVERHLMDDDYVLFNRQPSLHKMSMMGHKVKVLPGLTFRLNLSVTTPYNADFDGDEMNMHVPQSIEASTEVSELMMTNKVIVSSQHNRPVMGIVQDALLASFLMTRRDVFLDRRVFFNTVVSITDYKLPKPAIMIIDHKTKTVKEYWTGKQALSLAIPRHVNAISIPKGEKIEDLSPNDTYIQIISGQIISGSIGKTIIGNKEGSIIHTVFNDLGPEVSKNMFDKLQNIANYWILNNSFSIGIQDIVLKKKTRNLVKEQLESVKKSINDLEIEAQKQGRHAFEETFEDKSIEILTKARIIVGSTLTNLFTFNNGIKCTVTSGSKAKQENIAQISGFLGQQNVNGKRIKSVYNDRTLPHYTKYDSSISAKGFVSNSYCSGLNPHEFFFHAMAGRVSGVDNATQTARVGYLQRKLVKATEDIKICYDNTVRNGSGIVIQEVYGYDGIDAKNVELQKIELLGMSNNDIELIVSNTEEYNDLIIKKQNLQSIANTRKNPEFNEYYIPVNIDRIVLSSMKEFCINGSSGSGSGSGSGGIFNYQYVHNEIKKLLNELPNKDRRTLFDTNVLFKLSSKTVIDKHNLTKDCFDSIVKIIKETYYKSLAQIGEACGILAAQAIGEPLTQQSLSSFHSVGAGLKGMTQGIPRTIELLDVTKNPKSPAYVIYLDKEHKYDQIKALKIVRDITFIKLNKLIKSNSISDDKIKIIINNDILLSSVIDLEFIIKKIIESFIDLELIIESSNEDPYNPYIIIGVKDQNLSGNNILSVILNEISNIELRGLKGLERCQLQFINSKYWSSDGILIEESEWIINAIGRCFNSLLSFPGIDNRRTKSLDTLQTLETLGIEAARTVLSSELVEVTTSSDYVNNRHMEFMAEVMSNTGEILPITRFGITGLSQSPIMKASFEKTAEVFINAGAFAQKDNIINVSENILLGKLVPVGTGMFKVIDQKTGRIL